MHDHRIPTAGTEIRRVARELKIGQTPGFDGTPSKLHQFLQECRLYLQVNKDVYDTNDKKVAYVLSLINGGTALLWKEQLLRKMINDQGEYVFPNITALYQGLENDFKSTDDKEDALEKLAITKQGNRNLADHNAYFMLLISRSGLDPDENNTVLIKYYQRSLDPDILTAIWNNNPRPQTIGQWMLNNCNSQGQSYEDRSQYETSTDLTTIMDISLTEQFSTLP
jgi:hypothetical protein